jgi:ribose transport system permease protein
VSAVQSTETNDTRQRPALTVANEPTVRARPSRPSVGARIARGLAFNNIGAVYVWLAIVVVFSIWVPETFPTIATVKQVLNANAITALAALAITIPLAARVFDLSFAYTMTLTGVITAHFLSVGVPLAPSILLGLAAGVLIGVVNAFVVVVLRIDSFIATLATGSLIQALITMATKGTAIISTKLQGGFQKIGQTNIDGVTLPVIYVLVLAVAMWFLLEHTATGRRLYATGFNARAAKLAGVRVDRLRFLSLVASGSMAGAAGLVLASTIGSGDPTAGTSYLLPAFAAAFLGATQLKHGRFNAFGTLIAVLLLGTGTTGLGLANAPQWAADMFVGVVLIASLAVTGIQRRSTSAEPGRVRTLWTALRSGAGTPSFIRR